MAGPDDADRNRRGPGETPDPTWNANRTVPSLDLEALRRQYEEEGGGRRLVRLGPDAENTGEIEVPGAPRPVLEPSISRQQILSRPQQAPRTGQRPLEAQRPAPADTLDRLVEALAAEPPPIDPPLYLPNTEGDPFEGMMGSTLELRIDPALFGGTPEHTPPSDVDLRWLSPPEAAQALLPNSYHLSDEQVASACLGLYRGIGNVSGEALIVVGAIGRLEARIVDLFAPVGQLWEQLEAEASRPGGEAVRQLLEPTGALTDTDLQGALKLWREDRHDAKFWADDDGARLKAARLVGGYLLRRRGEALSRLPRNLLAEQPSILRLVKLVDQVRAVLQERQALIQRYFPAQSNAFGATFLVQRGINARPGFFWAEAVREEL